MRKLILSAALAATALGGIAYAAQEMTEDSRPSRGDWMLKRVDANGDGAISRDEMRSQAEKRFARRDRNADGKLTGEELAGRGARGGYHGGKGGHGMAGGPAMIDRLLDRIDADKDGTITPAERQNARAQFEARRTAMRERMLKRVDTDGDGAVSRAESLAAADQRFARLDSNRDNRIDAAEREAARAKRMERRHAMRAGMQPPSGADVQPDAPTGE